MFYLQFDGAASPNPGPMGVGAVLYDNNGNELDSSALFAGEGTNNLAEYLALKEAVKLALKHNVKKALFAGDSSLVINQMIGCWNCNNATLKAVRNDVLELLSSIEADFRWISRGKNKRADELSKKGLNSPVQEPLDENKQSLKEVTSSKSTKQKRIGHQITDVIYHKGVGFSVIDDEYLYAVNLSPTVSCTCNQQETKCAHIKAALSYAKSNRKIAA